MLKGYKLTLFFLALLTSAVLAQNYRISGSVSSAATGEELIGANVYVIDLATGAATDADGKYSFMVPRGSYTIKCSYVGYETEEVTVNVTNNMELNFALEDYQFSLNITVLADRAKERETPVAYTDINAKEMERRLGSRDIPLVLNNTPSVYATQQGGGSGDARINIRGFNQRNVAIMINGVPINDMENGWVYWSNWDGVADATSSIQVQRGLSAVNLATPSIGGTMNVITNPAVMEPGFSFKQEIGNDSFIKSTLFGHTGLVDDKWAVSAGFVKKWADGVVQKTWSDAYAYYFGASYNLSANHRLELYALGAPQRHGQNSYRQNIGVYDQEYAKDLDSYDQEAFTKFHEEGREYNQNWSPVSSSYNGQQYYWGGTNDRYDDGFIMERENYYHKPVVNLNWYAKFTERFSLYTTAYFSGGQGGGSGTYGSLVREPRVPGSQWYNSLPWYWNWDATISRNDTSSTGSLGILRNSVNNQWTIGAISKAYFKMSDALTLSLGVDWRTAEVDHFREVRDLLGGDYYRYTGNEFETTESEYRKGLGDKIDYYFTNNIDWIGGYLQGELKLQRFTIYGTFGLSGIKYNYENHFLKEAGTNNKLTQESDFITGYQVKGGASYRLTTNWTIYGNLGYVSKVPIFDDVIDDRTGLKNDEWENEEFVSIEGGFRFAPTMRNYYLNLNGYYTTWNNRTYKEEEYQLTENEEVMIFLMGVDSRHMGVELEAGIQPHRIVRFDGAVSYGSWEYTNDVDGETRVPGSTQTTSYKVYIDGLKVGDAPQFQLAASTSLYPVRGLMVQLIGKYYDEYYSDFNPFSRQNPDDRIQPWQVPSYVVFDAHLSYDVPVDLGGFGLQLYGHVFNLFDTDFIQDATDNSQYSAWDNDHDADDAEVFFGLPRFFNVGLRINY